jgi:hypothetical protein
MSPLSAPVVFTLCECPPCPAPPLPCAPPALRLPCKALDARDSLCMYVTHSGAVYGFGHAGWGQLGLDEDDASFRSEVATPAAIPLPPSIAVAAGGSHSIVCARDGSLWAFGRALHGRLGLGGGGQSVHRPTQLKLPGGLLCCGVAAGGFGSAALTRDGQVLTWGASQNGELGRNTFDNSNVPAPVHGLEGVRIVKMSLGGFHGLGLDDQGRVWGWGFNGSMQLGVKDKKVVPQAEQLQLPTHSKAIHVAAGGAHSLVVLEDGRCVMTVELHRALQAHFLTRELAACGARAATQMVSLDRLHPWKAIHSEKQARSQVLLLLLLAEAAVSGQSRWRGGGAAAWLHLMCDLDACSAAVCNVLLMMFVLNHTMQHLQRFTTAAVTSNQSSLADSNKQHSTKQTRVAASKTRDGNASFNTASVACSAYRCLSRVQAAAAVRR